MLQDKTVNWDQLGSVTWNVAAKLCNFWASILRKEIMKQRLMRGNISKARSNLCSPAWHGAWSRTLGRCSCRREIKVWQKLDISAVKSPANYRIKNVSGFSLEEMLFIRSQSCHHWIIWLLNHKWKSCRCRLGCLFFYMKLDFFIDSHALKWIHISEGFLELNRVNKWFILLWSW